MHQNSVDTASDCYLPILGLDIGGTISKVSLAAKKGTKVIFPHLENLTISVYSKFDVYFFTVPSRDITQLTTLIKNIGLHTILTKVYITGGGAYKYQEHFKVSSTNMYQQDLNLEVIKVEEFDSLRRGFDFLDQLTPNDSFFTYSEELGNTFIERDNSIYPFLLVNIGSGVSIIKFEANSQYSRVGGTSLGGGMFLGLCNAMTGIKDYDELLLMSNQGTSKGELEDCLDHVNKDNVIKSLLYMTAYNISQLAFLWTKKLNINRVFFSGYFIRGHQATIQCITESFQQFSQAEASDKQAYFVKHDGFVGSLGALQQALQEYNAQ